MGKKELLVYCGISNIQNMFPGMFQGSGDFCGFVTSLDQVFAEDLALEKVLWT
jgi:hypothetical protein